MFVWHTKKKNTTEKEHRNKKAIRHTEDRYQGGIYVNPIMWNIILSVNKHSNQNVECITS